MKMEFLRHLDNQLTSKKITKVRMELWGKKLEDKQDVNIPDEYKSTQDYVRLIAKRAGINPSGREVL